MSKEEAMYLRLRHLDFCPKSLLKVCQRRCTLTKIVFYIVILVLVLLCHYLVYHRPSQTRKSSGRVVSPPISVTSCNMQNFRCFPDRGPNNHNTNSNLPISRRVLILVESPYAKTAKKIVNAIDAARFPVKVISDERNLPTLTHMNKGRFGLIIFETIKLYLSLNYWNRQLIDKYCRDYSVGMIFFVKPHDDYLTSTENLFDFHMTVQYNVGLKDYRLNSNSYVWRILKPGEVISGPLPQDNWAVFHTNHSTYEPLAYAELFNMYYDDFSENYALTSNQSVYPAVLDKGFNDGIKRVFFGYDFTFWLHSPMLLDCVSFLSHGRLILPLERNIQIDVDDIFVGAEGTRMKAEDVEHMLLIQSMLQTKVDGFHFVLGFSGWYFEHGNDEEDEGDRLFVKYAKEFYWFPHMWRHEQAHKFSEEELQRNMYLNYQFAKEHSIPVLHQYAVAPHHSGVYPVHEGLYNSWKTVWDIRVTSTEEYPKLYPSWGRRGFMHKGIMVLPRQTCGLFTHTIFLDSYPGGRTKLDTSIHGGDLFRSFLYNPISIFMTHLSNYGNDRLALYTFESAIKFVQCWTNLKLRQQTPIENAIKYFDLYPEDELPVWKNPCDYDRHLEIWSLNKTCSKLPRFLVVGPQKTGTTALYSFLSMHPLIRSNYNSKETFEEVQFFSGKNYLKGIDWYMDFFPRPTNSSSEYLFEKSATYFDNALVPMRAHALLPNARIVCILINPAKRAYSWYQHIRAHDDPIATNMSFFDVISASETAPSSVKSLRNRCLEPGLYEHHLNNWLDFYSSRQIFIMDGEKLKNSPVEVMTKLQKFLNIVPAFDYSKVLRFDSTKGFYCQVTSEDRTKCLGRSKGRHYPPMDNRSEEFLHVFYRKHNLALSKLLDRLDVTKPAWLLEELKEFDSTKGFYCQVTSEDRTKCLGRSKGRHYPPMDDRSEEFLHVFYRKHNLALSKLLDRLDVTKPAWLLEELKEFDSTKGFYCQVTSEDRTKCLGRSKGRHYPPMDDRAEEFLHVFYRKHNLALSKLLDRLDVTKPAWLLEDLKEFDSTKGFYCQVTSEDRTKCLGRSKGRHYPPMDNRSEEFLHVFYRKHNLALSKLLDRLDVTKPSWLLEELKEFDSTKGFYCQVTSEDRTKCLGRSKGRHYPPMDNRSEEFLHVFYRKHNLALSKLLDRLDVTKPAWLLEELKE